MYPPGILRARVALAGLIGILLTMVTLAQTPAPVVPPLPVPPKPGAEAGKARIPDDLLGDEHVREEFGVNEFTTPSIRKLFEMLDGLGLAETTPGPLILVTQFVGFLGAWRQAGAEPSLWAATLGALLTTWVTFLPCFVWIFAGAPHVDRLRSQKALSAALSAITAAVVGVIANLAMWFALNLLFRQTLQVTSFGLDMQLPVFPSVNLPELLLSVIAFGLLFLLRLPMLAMLGTCALLGMGWTLLV